ncbi:hypothetical protein [Streptomyces sp. b94]|uniref:hypothetical protein n=1 Tax=Streptomyces sp. b94 TaxID=1827634 RepID=UPI001FFC5049|nr:hypothetical protein [Streptomyces sp. b94]
MADPDVTFGCDSETHGPNWYEIVDWDVCGVLVSGGLYWATALLGGVQVTSSKPAAPLAEAVAGDAVSAAPTSRKKTAVSTVTAVEILVRTVRNIPGFFRDGSLRAVVRVGLAHVVSETMTDRRACAALMVRPHDALGTRGSP